MFDQYASLLDAAGFAARAHRHQVRKDGKTPYFAHPARVCLIVRHVFGVEDPKVLTTALLHDTIEDSTTDADDIGSQFGPEVASWVGSLSKDPRLPEPEREAAYTQVLANAPVPVKIAKMADIFDNVLDSRSLSSSQRAKTIRRVEGYLQAMSPGLTGDAKRALDVVSQLIAETKQFTDS